MFGEFAKRRDKEVDVLEPKFKVPEKYYPEWYNRGLVPFEVDDERAKERMTMQDVERKRIPAKIIEDEGDVPHIKLAAK